MRKLLMEAIGTAFLRGALLALAATLATAAAAQVPSSRTAAPATAAAPPAGSRAVAPCAEGVVKEDGSAETGWGWVPSVVEGIYVQQFDSSEVEERAIEEVCVCWLRTGNDADLDFEMVFYRDAGGRPALTPYAAVPATASGLPLGISTNFFEVPVSGVGVPAGTFYVGVRWNPNADPFFFLCADTDLGTPVTDVYFIDDRAEGWTSVLVSEDPIFVVHRAVMVRLLPIPVSAVQVPVLGGLGLALLGAALAAVGLRRLRDP